MEHEREFSFVFLPHAQRKQPRAKIAHGDIPVSTPSFLSQSILTAARVYCYGTR